MTENGHDAVEYQHENHVMLTHPHLTAVPRVFIPLRGLQHNRRHGNHHDREGHQQTHVQFGQVVRHVELQPRVRIQLSLPPPDGCERRRNAHDVRHSTSNADQQVAVEAGKGGGVEDDGVLECVEESGG